MINLTEIHRNENHKYINNTFQVATFAVLIGVAKLMIIIYRLTKLGFADKLSWKTIYKISSIHV